MWELETNKTVDFSAASPVNKGTESLTAYNDHAKESSAVLTGGVAARRRRREPPEPAQLLVKPLTRTAGVKRLNRCFAPDAQSSCGDAARFTGHLTANLG